MEVWAIAEAGVGKSIVSLRRKKAAHCNVCDREHEHENAFISIDPRWGNLYFYCWREHDTERSKKIKIGEVETGYNEQIASSHLSSLRRRLNLGIGKTNKSEPTEIVERPVIQANEP